MSYILVTYGYNQFSLFNIKTSTPTLIDKIKEVAFQNIVQKLQARDKSLQKELDQGVVEEEKLNKLKSSTEQDLQIEKDKYDEAVRQLEAKRKKEELEQKKKEAEAKNAKGKKKEEKKAQEKKKAKGDKKLAEETVDDKPILEIKEKLDKIIEDINTLNNNKNINLDKKNKVQQFLAVFTKKFKERMNIKIDLIDAKGEKVNINSKGDVYSNEYLIEKTVYELNSFNIPQKTEEEPKDSKKNTKKDFKKEEKKKEAKESKDNKDILRDKSKNKDPYTSDSIWLLCELLKSDIYFDFNTVMFRREFVLDKGIKFYEDFNYGYAEAFIYNMLLNSPKIACCETKPVYDNINSSANDEAVPNTSCYGRIDSMIRIYENSVSLHPDNKYLNDLFEYRKLPSVVMSVVRILTKEEFSYAAIKRSFKQKGYNKLLKTSHMTPHELRREIFIWNTFPWLYKP